MSRISYTEDEDFPGQFELWQANCRRSLSGKAGQAILRELEQALLAMPNKRLIDGELQNAEGDVCAVGALMRHRGVTETKADPEEMEEVGVELGMPRLVAWKIVCLNDHELVGYGTWAVTPEQRYKRVLAWVRKQIKKEGDSETAPVA